MNPLDNREATLIVQNNIYSVFSLSVKTILEKSCFQETVDEFSPDVLNFLNVLDHIIYFCNKGTGAIYSSKISNHPWKLFYQTCKNIPNNCINTLLQINTLRSNFAKVRALIKMALIEKRLHLYISTAFNDEQLNRKFYTSDSIILSARFPTLLNEMLGLAAVDFNFDLKVDMNYPGFYPLDYSSYLKYYQTPESVLDDFRECNQDHGGGGDEHYCLWKEKYDLMFDKAKKDSKQNGYLQEILLNKESQLEAEINRNNILEKELKIMEDSVTDLQVQLTLLHEQYLRELDRIGGQSSSLLVPSMRQVMGSRADLTSSRHKLACQLSEIESVVQMERVVAEFEQLNQNELKQPQPQQQQQMYISTTTNSSNKSQEIVEQQSIKQEIENKMNDSTSSSGSKVRLKTQTISSKTKRYYSPGSLDVINRRHSTTDLGTKSIQNNAAAPMSPIPTTPTTPSVQQQQTTQPKQESNLEKFLKLSSSNDNGLLQQSLCLIHNKDTDTKIKESQQLRRIIGKANRSPLIKAHRRSIALLDEDRNFNLYDNYDSLSLEELNFSSFNSSITTNRDDDVLNSNWSNGLPNNQRRQNNGHTIRFHQPSDPTTYYTQTTLHDPLEQFTEDDYFDATPRQLYFTIQDDSHLIYPDHPDHPSHQVRQVINGNPPGDSQVTASHHNHLINGYPHIYNPPETIQNPPMITGEVPDNMRPHITRTRSTEQDQQNTSDHQPSQRRTSKSKHSSKNQHHHQ